MAFSITRRRSRPGPVRKAAAALMAAVLAVATAPAPAFAQQKQNLPLIRDAEIESLLRDYMTPIFRAAGQNPAAIEIILVNSREFNAFVAAGRRIFVNVGALMDAKTPNEIIGVLAHETGHIAGGHLARMRQRLDSAQTMVIVGTLLGLGAVAGAAAGGVRNTGGAAIGALGIPQDIAMRSLLAYQRADEEAADRAAVSYLDRTGQSAKGMLTTFKRFADQVQFSRQFIDPYRQTHPLPAERIANLESLATKSPNFSKLDSPALQARHDLMRAKLVGFTDTMDGVGRRYPPSDVSLPAKYARAIATYRSVSLPGAVQQIDALIAAQPQNPWFHELKGQAYEEYGKPAQAIPELRRALALAPNASLIRAMLGKALNETGGRTDASAAISELTKAVARDDKNADGYSQLAVAYAKNNQLPEADLATAQAAFAAGDYPTAKQIAERAKRGLKTGSPGWLKADDIANYQPQKLN